ncbi:MAG: DUF29 domain-containing protein [Rhodospirillaceae bacterium]
MSQATSETYETDFYAWANEQAALLRAGNLNAADLENIAEEIESMGRSEKRELVNRLIVLLTHLLKWQYQPNYQCSSWQTTIWSQRRELARHLKDNPSLRAKANDILLDVYPDVPIKASLETGFKETAFPQSCPWSFSQIMDEGFWPGTDA